MSICEFCRKRDGERFVDNFWTCEQCREDYLLKIETESSDTRFVLHLIGLVDGGRHEYSDSFVVSYDPDAHRLDGTYDGGKLIVTRDKQRARTFASWSEAFNVWRACPQCLCHARREDGLPNRPLTAFHAQIVSVSLCPK